MRKETTNMSEHADILQAGSETAYVLTKRVTHEQRFVLRRCTRRDFPAIQLIQLRVRRKVPSRSLYVMTPRRDILESLKKDYCIGAWDGSRLVGFAMVLSLRETDRNLAYALGYDPEYALRCVTFDGAWIDPQYQGYGLQQCFCLERERYARRIGAAEILTCTSPNNHACRRTLEKCGHELVAQRNLFGGVPRVIYSKQLSAEAPQKAFL